MRKIYPALLAVAIAGCNPAIYTHDGVTDGDTFYLSPQAMAGGDPVLQSWVVYSLARAACQLEVGETVPSRVGTFDCEYRPRRLLADDWADKQALDPSLTDPYLDTLVRVRDAGYLGEYVVAYFGQPGWDTPAGLETGAFSAWRRARLRGHTPETRITGSWSFAPPDRTIDTEPPPQPGPDP